MSETEAHNSRHPFVSLHVHRREWREALAAPLPEGDHLRVCREQAPGERPGISWRLDHEQSAAASGDGPGPAGGTVLCGDVDRSDILGYFVGDRGGEVIADPARIRGLVRVTAWRRPPG